MTFRTIMIDGIGLCLQAGIIYRLQENFFSPQRNRYLGSVSCMLLYLMTSLTASYTFSQQGWYILYSILRQGSLMLLLTLFFQGGLWHRASLAAILCVSSEFTINALGEILSLISMFFPAQRPTYSALFVSLSYPLAAVILWFIFRRMKLRPDLFSEQICRLLFFIMCGLILLTDTVYHGITHGVIMIAHTDWPEVFNPYTSEVLTHIQCIILALLSLSMALSLPAALNRIMQQALSEQIQRTQIAHYQTLLEEHRRQVNLRHDLKNHILVLERLTEQGALDQISGYLRSMHQETYKATGNIHTGNLTADALIDIKELDALARNVSFTCELQLPKQLPLKDFDLCIVLGNLLDNAIQGASCVPDGQRRHIILQSWTVKRNFLLEIKNTATNESGLLHFGTDQYGTGLHNVENIIEKYNGMMDISYESSLFCVSILIPIYDTALLGI